MTRQPRVYFAASLFNEAEREFNQKVVAMIRDLGYSTWFPQEDVGLPTDLAEQLGMSIDEARDHVFRHNIKELREADIVVLVLDGRVPDEGACMEAGIAWGLGKPVYALKTDTRRASLAGDNVMITGVASRTARSINELRELLEPVHTIVDITGDEPVVTVRHGSPDMADPDSEPTPPAAG